GGAGDTVLHVAGPGTVLLAQSANYVGSWAVDAGTLKLNDASGLGTGTSLNIAAGTMVDVTPIGAASWNPTTAGIGGKGTGTTVGSTAATIKADASGIVDL